MKIRILEIAQLEFNEAKEFYEIEQTGLGVKYGRRIKNKGELSWILSTQNQ